MLTFYLMKQFKSLIIFILIFNYFTSASSQKLAAGYYGGVNFSDIHGNGISGKWKFKPGPSEGIYIDYSLNRIFGFRTGVKYYTNYYEHIYGYQAEPYLFLPEPWPRWPYNQGNEKMDFSFISFPLQVRLSIPSLPGLDLMAGIYEAFITDYSENYPHEFLKPPKSDFGYIYSVGFTIPLTDRLKAIINSSYTTGRTRILDYSGTHNGSIDFNLGIAWKGFLKDKNRKIKEARDTASEKVFLIYKGGFNVSWNSGEKEREKYSLNTGPSIGFLINFRLSPNSSLRTGLSFDRTGYSLKDSSDSFYRYYLEDYAGYYVDSRISIDYLTLPLLVNFDIGHNERFFFNAGPYIDIRLNARCKGTAYFNAGSQGSYNLYERVIYDDLTSAIKQYDFGWIFGGGVNFILFKKLTIESGLQYRKGFRDVFKEAYLMETSPAESTESILENSSFSFQIGLRVPVFR